MGISEKKMQIVINNYFKQECDVNTSIREAFEKGFRIGIKKTSSAQPDTCIKTPTAADVVPYSISPDGTLTITVPKGTYKKINRVLVEEDGTHWGGLCYAD